MNFICLECHKIKEEHLLIKSQNQLQCKVCNSTYSIVSGRPILIPQEYEELINQSKKAISNTAFSATERFKDVNVEKIWSNEMFPKLSVNDLHWRFLKKQTCEMLKEINKESSPNSVILDIGAGDARYGKMPYREDIKYIPTDLVFTNSINANGIKFISMAEDIPIVKETIDIVFNFAVLEHLKDPAKCLSEMARILKTGGTGYMIVPLVRPEHMQPHDYHRFTRFWIEEHLNKNSLIKKSILGSNNALWTSFYYLEICILTWPFQNIKPRIVSILINRLFYFSLLPLRCCAKFFDKYFNDDFPMYYWVKFSKT